MKNFGGIFFPPKGKSYIWTKNSFVLLVKWHILKNRIVAKHKSNEAEKSEKSVGCDLVVLYRFGAC